MLPKLEIESMRIAGNGSSFDNWLNGIEWDPENDANLMKEVAPLVYEITYEEVEAYGDYKFKFVSNGSWADNWGLETNVAIDTETDLTYNGDPITLDTTTCGLDLVNITIRLDLSSFDYSSKTGAKMLVTITDPNAPVYVYFNANNRQTWDAPYYAYIYDDESSTDMAYSNAQYPGEKLKYDEASGYYYIQVPESICRATTADGDVLDSAFDLAHSSNTKVIFLDNSGRQYPSYSSKIQLKTNGSSKIFAETSSTSWTNTSIVPEDYVNIFGDINLELIDDGTGFYSATVEIAAGSYDFIVDKNGTEMYFGYIFTDTASSITYSSSFKAATTINATGGYYTFNYDINTNRLSVSHKAYETEPTEEPTTEPTTVPVTEPTEEPTTVPVTEPTEVPTTEPTTVPVTTEPNTEPITTPVKDELTVNATSNLFTSQTATYNKRTNKLIVTYWIKSSKDMLNTQWQITYDPELLTVCDDSNTADAICPAFTENPVLTINNGIIKFNAYNLSLYDISSDETIFARVVFDVNDFETLGIYETEINLNVLHLTLSALDSSTSMNDEEEEVRVVYNGVYDDSYGLIVSERIELTNIEIPEFFGDADGSGDINIHDATLIAKYIIGLAELTEEQILVSDCNGDGIVNIKDATSIQRYLADIPNSGYVGQEYVAKNVSAE